MSGGVEAVPTTVIRSDSNQVIDCWPEMNRDGEMYFVIRRLKAETSEELKVVYLRLSRDNCSTLIKAIAEADKAHGN